MSRPPSRFSPERLDRSVEAVTTAERLRVFVDDPAIVNWFIVREKQLIEALLIAPSAEREECVGAIKLLRDLRAYMDGRIEAGDAAAKLLREIKHE